MGFFMRFGTTEPVPWEVAFGTSFLPAPLLLGIRWVCAFVFVCNFIILIYQDAIRRQRGIFSFIVLTNWGYAVETAYACILPLATAMAQRALAQPAAYRNQMGPWSLANREMGPRSLADREMGPLYAQVDGGGAVPTNKQPPLISAAVALFTIAHPISLLVLLLFWVLLVPFQETCIFTGGVEPCTNVSPLNLYLHFGDWVLLLMLFFIGRIPFYIQNSLYFVAFSFSYGLFTILHFVLKIGVAPVDDCPEYPRKECPIYDILDYHFPGQAFTLLFQVLFIAVPLMIIIYWGLGWVRACCCSGY